jgi:hypothetical protein
MIASRPRKSDAVLIALGVIIFLVLVLGIVFVVRRRPEVPQQAPGVPGAALHHFGCTSNFTPRA